MWFLVYLILAVALIILDRFVSGYILVSLAIGCVLGAFASFLDMHFVVQLATVVFGFVVSLLFIRPVLRKTGRGAKEYAKSLIGREVDLIDSIDKTGIGKVRVDGLKWYAVSLHHEEIMRGEKVIVRDVKGTTLTVEKINRI